MAWNDEGDAVQFSEPIQPKKDCRLEVSFAEPASWKVKEHVPGYAGQEFKAAKLTLRITDEQIETEHAGGKPKLTIEHQFNVDRYPYLNKKTGEVGWMGRQALFELEEAFGFDPVFTDAGGVKVEPFISKTGRKMAPKGNGIQRVFNPEFASAYFHPNGTINPDNWVGKTVYADVEVEKSDQYGDKNVIKRFKRAPALV